MDTFDELSGEIPPEFKDQRRPDTNLPEPPHVVQDSPHLKATWEFVQDLYSVVLRSKIGVVFNRRKKEPAHEWVASAERNKLRRQHGPFLLLGLHYLAWVSSKSLKTADKTQWEFVAKHAGQRLLEADWQFSHHDCVAEMLQHYNQEGDILAWIKLAVEQATHAKQTLERTMPLELEDSSMPQWLHLHRIWELIARYLESNPPMVRDKLRVLDTAEAKRIVEEIRMRIKFLAEDDD
ncbi:MAG: hypothetical protein Q9227_008939 [Pyrenula ochraceoflavens]